MAKPKLVVAIVDDDERLLESLQDLVESAGYRVRTFASARALLDSEAIPEIDCLITDIGMPELDGFELSRIMQTRRPELPVILVTGGHDISGLAQAKQKRLFRKPFDGHELLAAIGESLTDRGGST
jgi:FixJ family two-component response regulator